MSLVPLLDLRSSQEGRLQANIDAEQALLGILLYDNGAADLLGDDLSSEDFVEPFHRALFEEVMRTIASGRLAEPILVRDRFQDTEAFQTLGGMRYLASLVEHAPPRANTPDYARTIHDFANRRAALDLAEAAAKDLRGAAETKDAVEALESGLFALAERRAPKHGLRAFASNLDSAMETAAEAYRRDGSLSGLSTGLVDVDRRLGGLQPSDLIVLAARPSMGKTALATNIAFRAAKRGEPVAYFSPEMSAGQLTLRILGDVADVSSDLIRRGDINEQEFRSLRDERDVIQDIPLFIDDTGAISLPTLAARARRQKRRTGLSLIVVDYLQLMTTGLQGWRENRATEIGQISAGLKAIAKELNVPVLALAQLSRQVENRDNKRPQLADLRESGSIEQDADVVLFLYREAYYLSRQEPTDSVGKKQEWDAKIEAARGVAELIIGKQRHGPIGLVKLHFDEDRTRFSNAARDSEARAFDRLSYGGARD